MPSYKLKRIQYFKREVPIALQNENGPCPLLAIANVLLLRNQIKLPANAPDVSQVGRLLQPVMPCHRSHQQCQLWLTSIRHCRTACPNPVGNFSL